MGVLRHHTHIIRARDQGRIAAFWQALGFQPNRKGPNAISFYAADAPGLTVLEITRLHSGSEAQAPVADRTQRSAMCVFDSDDIETLLAAVPQLGGTVLETLDYPEASLTYVADPEWNVMGFRRFK